MDWSNAQPGMEQKIAEEGDRYLGGQLTIATSADQRAAVLSTLFTGAATAVLVGLVAVANSETIIANKTPIYIGGGVIGLMFFVAAILCISAIMPVRFYIPGTEPKTWTKDLTEGKEVNIALRELCENIQLNIADNDKVIKANAQRFKWGALIGIGAPMLGTVIGIAAAYLRVCS